MQSHQLHKKQFYGIDPWRFPLVHCLVFPSGYPTKMNWCEIGLKNVQNVYDQTFDIP